jgi:hypothetical protein
MRKFWKALLVGIVILVLIGAYFFVIAKTAGLEYNVYIKSRPVTPGYQYNISKASDGSYVPVLKKNQTNMMVWDQSISTTTGASLVIIIKYQSTQPTDTHSGDIVKTITVPQSQWITVSTPILLGGTTIYEAKGSFPISSSGFYYGTIDLFYNGSMYDTTDFEVLEVRL